MDGPLYVIERLDGRRISHRASGGMTPEQALRIKGADMARSSYVRLTADNLEERMLLHGDHDVPAPTKSAFYAYLREIEQGADLVQLTVYTSRSGSRRGEMEQALPTPTPPERLIGPWVLAHLLVHPRHVCEAWIVDHLVQVRHVKRSGREDQMVVVDQHLLDIADRTSKVVLPTVVRSTWFRTPDLQDALTLGLVRGGSVPSGGLGIVTDRHLVLWAMQWQPVRERRIMRRGVPIV